MTSSEDVKTIRELMGQVSPTELAKENRRLRFLLGDLINVCDDWYYGPLSHTQGLYELGEPVPLLRARAFLCGDMRRVYWIKRAALSHMALKRRLRKMPAKLIHVLTGLWIFALGFLAIGIGQLNEWWEPENGLAATVAAFGGYMSGGMMMWARMHFRQNGIRL